MISKPVTCCICGRGWPAGDPRVLYRSEDGRWWCRNGWACNNRADGKDPMRPDDKTSIEVYAADRDRVNDLARQLTAAGPGRFGQAETLRWLLDLNDKTAAMIADALAAGDGR